ncbi:Uncharacterized protein conserved in archaea [Methanosarcina barkeri 3]|uniref:Uncharacterized protein conserved in archaea n=1 Tax=Methanosarcina barkeri 3 TaxID=1434107 RepID=A0A0E3SNL9_METBA|nr:DUF1786 domain-containing protein [Methanosarcina barkeri]AKB82823.1 Uncharacterized protein conserved in archaea [Methanosarcina barkeri 3]
MLILAVDVGTGTQDILYFNSEKEVENSLLMVMPAPTQIIAKKVRKATKKGKTIVFTGNIMGGGPSTFAIRTHLKAGFRVYATEKAALTINDNIEKVKSFGIQIVSEEEAKKLASEENVQEIVMQDFDPESTSAALSAFEVQMPTNYAVAVQDHGNAPEKSNRIYRFELLRELIEKGGELENFVYRPEEIPEAFTRMKAQADSLLKATGDRKNRAVFMDTGPAAIFGALTDPAAVQPSVVVNIGNGHTLGALVNENRIMAVFEHHTSLMSPEKLQDYIIRLADGKLGFDEVFEDGGHGAYRREAPGFEQISFEQVRSILVTGPKREKLEKASESEIREEISNKLHFAAPFGSMMLSGCFGLLAGFLEKYPEPSINLINH